MNFYPYIGQILEIGPKFSETEKGAPSIGIERFAHYKFGRKIWSYSMHPELDGKYYPKNLIHIGRAWINDFAPTAIALYSEDNWKQCTSSSPVKIAQNIGCDVFLIVKVKKDDGTFLLGYQAIIFDEIGRINPDGFW